MTKKEKNREVVGTSSNTHSPTADINLSDDAPPRPRKKKQKDPKPDIDPHDELPSVGDFLERSNNPVKKLRQGQGYDDRLGLTYLGTFPYSPFLQYGISLNKPIRAVHESYNIPIDFANDIRTSGGFTDPLTDKTLQQIKTLLHELHTNGEIGYRALSVLAKMMVQGGSRYLDFSHDLEIVLMVFWIIGTYLRALFTWYPYLVFEGLRDVGKSTALEFLSLTCFNGGGDVSGGHTEADLHKAAASTMGFFAIDHLEEKLKSDDKRHVINEFLENAWKLNSYVGKRDQSTGEQLRLHLACSVALGTRRTTETIAEKGLIIRMQETSNDNLRQRSVTMYKDEFFRDIEKELMAMALSYQDRIKETYESITVIPGLGREYNKFLPFLSIAKVIDDETNNENNYFNRLKDYALEYRKTRKEEREDSEEILLRLILKDEINITTYVDLAKLMNKEGYEKYSWNSAKSDIGKLGIVKNYNRNKSPITLDLDMKRAEERAKTRGIIIDLEIENVMNEDVSNEELWDISQQDHNPMSSEAEDILNQRLLEEKPTLKKEHQNRSIKGKEGPIGRFNNIGEKRGLTNRIKWVSNRLPENLTPLENEIRESMMGDGEHTPNTVLNEVAKLAGEYTINEIRDTIDDLIKRKDIQADKYS